VEGKVALRRIRVATIQGGIAAIAEGLAAGDTVVTEGHLRLTDGAQYRDAAAKPASSTASAAPADNAR